MKTDIIMYYTLPNFYGSVAKIKKPTTIQKQVHILRRFL